MAQFELPEAPDLPELAPPPVDPMAAREEKIANDTRVESEINRFLAARQDALFHAPDAFYRTEGEDAIHAAPETGRKLDALRRDLIDRAANDYQRGRLGAALGAQMELTRDGMARHVAEQSLAWQRQVAQDRIALLTKEAALHHGDDALIDTLGHAAAMAARAQARVGTGLPGGEIEDTAAATARSGVLDAAIQARLDRGDADDATALLTKLQGQLDPAHAAPLQRQIDTLQRLAAPTDDAVEWEAAPEPVEPGQQYAQADNPDDDPVRKLRKFERMPSKPQMDEGKLRIPTREIMQAPPVGFPGVTTRAGKNLAPKTVPPALAPGDSNKAPVAGSNTPAPSEEFATPKESSAAARSSMSSRIRLPENDAQLRHIFGDRPGHIVDTPENRQMLENLANDRTKISGTDMHGNVWYRETLPDGRQTWAKTRDGTIQGGGVNETPRQFHPSSGLSAPQRPNWATPSPPKGEPK